MGLLSFALLGRTDVRHGGVPLALPTRKALALLVYLAAEGGVHPRERLAALLWPESDRERARAMLRYTLAALRRALGEHNGASHLIGERDAIGLDAGSDIEIDLHALERAAAPTRAAALPAQADASAGTEHELLRRAVEHYQGDFLADLALPDAPDFDEWVAVRREHLRRQAGRAFDRLARLLADRGELAEAVDVAQRRIALSPVDEAAYRQLMRLRLALGDRPGALRAFEDCRAILAAELEVAPAAETLALAERIRLSEPPTPATPRAPDDTRAPGAALEGPLVGRADEFGALVEHFHATEGGLAQVVVLRGEAGIGKTRLATEFLAWAAGHGTDILAGRAFETGGRLPFQPLVDALRPRLDRENAPEALLGDVWLTELGRLLPELRERYPDLPGPSGDEAAARTRLFESVARLGQSLAGRAPVVLFVDDAQWADTGSLDLLRYAGRRWIEGRAPLLLLVGLRSEALADTPHLEEWLAGLHRDLAPTELALGPLSAAETLQLLRGFGARDRRVGASSEHDLALQRVAAWLFAETSGQPFFAVEAIRALIERGTLTLRAHGDGGWALDPPDGATEPGALAPILSPGMREVVRARLVRLTRPAREFLAAAAILGQGFTFEHLRLVSGLREDEALPALDAVMRAHLLRESAAGGEGLAATYAFAHDKIRDVAYAEAGEARQRVFHRRAVDALAPAAPAAQLAGHALAGGLQEAALRYSRAAGDEALRLLAARDALAHYDRAVAIAERQESATVLAELRARRGKAQMSLARWPDARREFEAALDGLGAERQDRRAAVLVDLLEVCWWLLDVPSVRRWATEALALAEHLGRGDVATVASGWLAAAVGADGDVPGCVARYEGALARGGALGVAPPAPLYTYYSLSLYWLGRFDEAGRRGDEGVRAAREADHTTAAMFSLPHLGAALAGQGRYVEALATFAEARRLGRQYGINTLLARAIAFSAGFHLDLWDFAGNEALAEEARAFARALGFAPPAVSAGIDLILNFARRREVDRAEGLIGEVAAAIEGVSGWHEWVWGLRFAEARAEIALARGDWQVALGWADDAIARSRARHRPKYEVLGRHTRAQALLALGRTSEALDDLRGSVTLARSVGDPALLLRPAAALLAVDGDDALAAEAAATVRRIVGALSDGDMRRRFEEAEPVRHVMRLAR
jgi:DNA-binding SARP family transcriptional activator